MLQQGVPPNAHTFTTIINACTQAHNVDRAHDPNPNPHPNLDPKP